MIKNLADDTVISTETFTYDAAGNVTDAPGSCFAYDTNNRLLVFNGNTVSYDLDGNMLSNGVKSFTYDSANRLMTAGGHTYTYNAENVRIRNLCTAEDTTYTYNTNCKLSQLLMKTTGGVVTKYVYGRGLIGEEVNNTFKTYHFDSRGSTIAITDASGNITDTFAYDTYGKQIARTGTSNIIFGYNGRDGVVTDKNGLIYMRARYYSPDMKRFVNADIIAGEISNGLSLNRYAYANGNPVSYVDPFGLKSLKERWEETKSWWKENVSDPVKENFVDPLVETGKKVVNALVDAGEAAIEIGSNVVDYIATDLENDIVEHVVKPAGEAFSNAGKQIKDGLNSALKNAKKIGNKVGEFAKNTFGAGIVQSQTYDVMSMDTLFFGYEDGYSTSSVICGDISKPISVYAKNASDWWKIWEYKIGIQANIGDGGFYFEYNLLEKAIGFSNENTSLEFMTGLNKIGYTASYEVDFSSRTSGGGYHHGYVRTIPTALAVVVAYYCWYALLGALAYGVGVPATT